jgi:hypothetical protein
MTPTIVFVPGLRDHVADHWQTLLAAEIPGARTVPPLEHDKLSLAARVEALQAGLAAVDGPAILVAHSAGVIITVHWALSAEALSGRSRVAAALLATPPDIATSLPPGYPSLDALTDGGWLPIPRRRLPFPSLVAASRNDPLARPERVAQMALDWGSDLIDLGAVGHLDPASGFGPWPRGHHLIDRLALKAGFPVDPGQGERSQA